MTREQILAWLDDAVPRPAIWALRAVVELHRPFARERHMSAREVYWRPWCNECHDEMPCSTIRAISDALEGEEAKRGE